MTPAIFKEIINWILEHIDQVEPLKTLLKHVYLPVKLSDEQLEEIITRVGRAKGNEGELTKISEDVAQMSEENIRQMFV